MIGVLSVFIGALFLLFSTILNAGPYGAKICATDTTYHCYKVKRGDTWDNLFEDDTERDLVMRINRMNTRLHPGMQIAIPVHLADDTNPMDYAPLNKHIDAPGKKVIIVSLGRLAFGAYDPDGTLAFWGPVSGARGYCPDIHHGCHSPTGRFYIYNKEGFDCISTKFPVGRGGAPMPYCMFFHGGFALHGSYEVPGYNASHGCIRMFVDDAQWLNEEFTEDGSAVEVDISNQ